MNSTFSNSTIKMFKRVMLTNLGEYISVRDNEGIVNKIKSGEIVNLRYQTRTFKNGKGIVITNLDHKTLNKPTDMTKLVNNVNEWIVESIKNGVVLVQYSEDLPKQHATVKEEGVKFTANCNAIETTEMHHT